MRPDFLRDRVPALCRPSDLGPADITDFGLSPQEIADMFRTSQAFFALPAEVKGRYGFDQVSLACFCIKRIAHSTGHVQP